MTPPPDGLPAGQCVAVIGMAGRFPGAADVDQFWQNLLAAREGITHYTDEELLEAGVPGRLLADPAYVRSGHPLDRFEYFDADFFGIPSSEAELMDPQHRQFLETAWHALERAGYPPRGHPQRTGVFAGVSASAYLQERIAREWQSEEVSDGLQAAIGNDAGTLSMRVSYKLDLTGPSFTVQSACSSSLVAVHLAVQSLLGRECDLALAGGVAVRQLEPRGYRYEEGAILSTDGHCRPFDAAATGTVPGDGVAAVVLKRLEEAIEDGDHIHAVVRGSAVNSDGNAKVGFTAPSPQGQVAVISEALAVAEVDSTTISYVEAHGTGTPLGDPVEVRALTEAFGSAARQDPCYLGAVKSNVGHLDAAAGITGLIKAALALEHRLIPPTLHFESPNPELGLGGASPFLVNTDVVPWLETAGPPRAGVSAFGVGGTNAHVVLEAAPQAPTATEPRGKWQVLPISARTPSAVAETCGRLADHLAGGTAYELPDIAYTLQVGRHEFASRCAVAAADSDGARAALTHVGEAVHRAADPSVVFLFPGQGSQYPGMGAELYGSEPVFRAAMDACSELLLPELGWDVREIAFGAGAQDRNRLRQTLYTQPAVFCVDYALARVLMSWGVRPDAMTGHSLGELVAACLAGVFTLPDMLRFVAARARLMQDLAGGRMLSALADEATVLRVLAGHAVIAAVNAPGSCVVAGTEAQVAEAARRLENVGIPIRELETSHAFHTPLVEPVLPGLAAVLEDVPLGKPELPLLSTVTGTWVTDDQATDPGYWVTHTRRPVRFSDAIATALAKGSCVLVEVGPGSGLSGLVRSRPDPERGVRPPVVTLLKRSKGEHPAEVRGLMQGVAHLWCHGVAVDWDAMRRRETGRRVPLPGYPFEGRGYLLPKPSGELTRRDASRWSYAPVWLRAPLTAEAEPGQERSVWLVLEDGSGLGSGLAEALRARGNLVTAVRAGDTFARHDEDTYEADPAQPDHLGRVVGDLRAAGRLPDRVLHAWAVAVPGPDDVLRRYQRALDTGLFSLVSLAQALGEAGEPRPVRIDVLTNDLQEAYGTPVVLPERATVQGAVTVLPQEYPGLTCRVVDVTLPADDQGREQLAALLYAELAQPRPEKLVAYRGTHRLRQSFAPVELAAVAPAAVWREGGGYLVTGAAEESGLMFAEHLAESGAKLVLIGDPGFPERDRWNEVLRSGSVEDRVCARIRRLAALVARDPDGVTFLTADLGDPAGARRAVGAARDRLGAVRGVLHLASVRGSGMVALKSRDEFAAVLEARVRSTLLLGELFEAGELDFFLLGSSTVGVVGGFGRSENCAVAAFLDAFAQAGAAAGEHIVAIDWAQWEWDDWFEQQVASLPKVRDQYERQRITQGIPAAEGLSVARCVLGSALPRVVVSTVDFSDVLADQSWLTASSFTESLRADRGSTGAAAWDPATVWPDDEVAQSVATVWRDLLGVSYVGENDEFYDIGGNSLFAIQIVSRLRQIHGDFPMSAIFEAPTVPGLTAAIRAYQAESIGLDEFEALLAEVEGLSPEEAEANLRGDHA